MKKIRKMTVVLLAGMFLAALLAGCLETGSGGTEAATAMQEGDVTPPAVPTGLKAAAYTSEDGGSAFVLLTWNSVVDNTGGVGLAAYHIFRDGTRLPSNSIKSEFRDINIVSGRTYEYQVAAADGAGNVSQRSVVAKVTVGGGGTTPPPPPPPAPTESWNVVIAASGSDAIVTMTFNTSTGSVGGLQDAAGNPQTVPALNIRRVALNSPIMGELGSSDAKADLGMTVGAQSVAVTVPLIPAADNNVYMTVETTAGAFLYLRLADGTMQGPNLRLSTTAPATQFHYGSATSTPMIQHVGGGNVIVDFGRSVAHNVLRVPEGSQEIVALSDIVEMRVVGPDGIISRPPVTRNAQGNLFSDISGLPLDTDIAFVVVERRQSGALSENWFMAGPWGGWLSGLTVSNDRFRISGSGGGTVPPPSTDSPTAHIAGGDRTVAAGSFVTLDGTGSTAPSGRTLSDYLWRIGATVIGTEAVVNHQFSVVGTFTVTLQVTDSTGATAGTSVVVTVTSGSTPPPSPDPGTGSLSQTPPQTIHTNPALEFNSGEVLVWFGKIPGGIPTTRVGSTYYIDPTKEDIGQYRAYWSVGGSSFSTSNPSAPIERDPDGNYFARIRGIADAGKGKPFILKSGSPSVHTFTRTYFVLHANRGVWTSTTAIEYASTRGRIVVEQGASGWYHRIEPVTVAGYVTGLAGAPVKLTELAAFRANGKRFGGWGSSSIAQGSVVSGVAVIDRFVPDNAQVDWSAVTTGGQERYLLLDSWQVVVRPGTSWGYTSPDIHLQYGTYRDSEIEFAKAAGEIRIRWNADQLVGMITSAGVRPDEVSHVQWNSAQFGWVRRKLGQPGTAAISADANGWLRATIAGVQFPTQGYLSVALQSGGEAYFKIDPDAGMWRLIGATLAEGGSQLAAQ